MRRLFATLLLAAATLAAAPSPASAGLGSDTYDSLTESGPNQQWCDAWRQNLPAFGSLGRVLWQGFVNCRDDLNEALRTIDDQGVCVVTEALASGFEEQAPGTPEPFATGFGHAATAFRAADDIYCHSDFRSVGDLFEAAPRPKSFVDPQLYPLYDLATAFPCGLIDPDISPLGQQVRDEFGPGPYDFLDCGENQFLHPPA